MEKDSLTQQAKIINMCIDGEWHCQNNFRAIYIFSPHKRRIEIEGRKNRSEPITGKYIFDERSCVHDFGNQKDYKMRKNPYYNENI